jgi:branched-subunit amino acid aminotransferase/4-amino-4-deoxychorismate lyase
MGEKTKEGLKVKFDKRLRLEFHGARITSDAGLLAWREFDGALELTEVAPTYLRETRGGRNVQHEIVPLLRQSVYSRLARYEDINDGLRLARNPVM